MDTMQALETDAARQVAFAPLGNKRGSLEQLWAQLFKAADERVLTRDTPAPAASDKS
jgi:hypothetical protein